VSKEAAISCRVCGAKSLWAFEAPLLGEPVQYYDCRACSFLQTQEPTWLDRAYERPINLVDTGILYRNLLNRGRVLSTLLALGSLNGRVIDHAGGYGILVRLLRDAGVDAAWQDKYCQNLMAVGFEADGSKFDLLTAFEVAEHLVRPLDELRAMFERADHVLWSTELVPAATGSASRDWWYLGPEHGQHIGFFRSDTLKYMADQLGAHVASDGQRVHLFSRRPVPASWRLLLNLPRLTAWGARLRIKSRTMSDFNMLRSAQLDDTHGR
jgi:Methyltransferase domain